MYKLSIKIEDPGSRGYQMAYCLLHDLVNELVFCGNLAAHIPAGTDSVIFDCERGTIKAAAEEIWRGDPDMREPDELLRIEWVADWEGTPDTRERKVELTKEDMTVIAATLADQSASLKATARALENDRDKDQSALCLKVASQCEAAMKKILRQMNPNA